MSRPSGSILRQWVLGSGLVMLSPGAALAADPRPVAAVVIGASTEWNLACAQEQGWDPSCREDTALAYADDDAWRVAYLLQDSLPQGRLMVFTRPDDSTRARSFPGGPPNPPRLEEILARIETLSSPHDVVLLVAGHGSSDGLHLEDRHIPFPELQTAIEEASRGRVRLVVADVCLSADWRGAVMAPPRRPDLPAVRISRRAAVEVMASGLTPESEALSGGTLTSLVLSALAGGADHDGDGVIIAQELSDFVISGVRSGNLALDPVIRSPGGVPTVPVPLSFGAGRLRIGHAIAPSRFIATTHVGGQPVVLLDLFTEPGEERTLSLPAGEYHLWRVPYEQRPDGRRVAAYEAGLLPVAIQGTALVDTWGREGQPQSIRRNRQQGGPAPEGEARLVGELVDQQAARPALAVRGSTARWHGGGRPWLGLGFLSTSASQDRGAPLLGATLGLRLASPSGRLHLLGRLEAQQEQEGSNPVSARYMGALAGAELTAWNSRPLRLGLGLMAGGGAFLFHAEGPGYNVSHESGALLGRPLVSFSWTRSSWALRAEAALAAQLVSTLEEGAPTLAPDLLRPSAALSLERAW